MEAKKMLEVDLKLKEQILDQIPTPVMAVDKEMHIIYMNESGKKMIKKDSDSFMGKLCYDINKSSHCKTNDCCMKKAMAQGKTYSSRVTTEVDGRIFPVEYYAVPLKNEKDETIGGLEFVVDISEQVQYEERLREQSKTIRQMSTPTIKLWDGILVLPVVGVVDSLRAQHMMESMLSKISETYSKVIIMDIQGVAAVDTAVANHLIKITKATKLMGCECILSGISPAVAQTLIQLGVDMTSIKTKATLSDALDEGFSLLDLQVTENKN